MKELFANSSCREGKFWGYYLEAQAFNCWCVSQFADGSVTLQEALDVLALMKFPCNTSNLFHSHQPGQLESVPMESALQVCTVHFTATYWECTGTRTITNYVCVRRQATQSVDLMCWCRLF